MRPRLPILSILLLCAAAFTMPAKANDTGEAPPPIAPLAPPVSTEKTAENPPPPAPPADKPQRQRRTAKKEDEDEAANPPRSARESLLGLVATAEANVAADPANMREVNRLHALRECLGFFPED